MNNTEFKILEQKLENRETIEFKYNNLFYEIFESSCSKGYIINVYSSNDKDESDFYFDDNLVDGGLCSGCPEDAILFML